MQIVTDLVIKPACSKMMKTKKLLKKSEKIQEMLDIIGEIIVFIFWSVLLLLLLFNLFDI